MARPFKQGVDYFPLDVHMDNKFKFIEIKYGLEGFAVVIKMLQAIYSQGYWAKWGEDEKLLFADENKVDYNKLEQITEECIKREVFNPELYQNYGIITSKGIQKRYKEIVRRRKDVRVNDDYLLIDNIKEVNDDINPSQSSHDDSGEHTSSEHDDVKSTQTERKQKQKEKTKEEKERHLDYVLLTTTEYERLKADYGQAVVDSKIEDLDTYLTNKGKNKFKDHNKTLRNWIKRDGIKTIKEKEEQKRKDEEPSIEETIKELDELLVLGKEYFKKFKTLEEYEEVKKERDRLEQLRVNQG